MNGCSLGEPRLNGENKVSIQIWIVTIEGKQQKERAWSSKSLDRKKKERRITLAEGEHTNGG
jgi:hypothetical protein